MQGLKFSVLNYYSLPLIYMIYSSTANLSEDPYYNVTFAAHS